MDAGETYSTAAHRETEEEAGVAIELKGILRIEHSPSKTGPGAGYYVRQRVVYYAEPLDPFNCVPKSIPDFESAGTLCCNHTCFVENPQLNTLFTCLHVIHLITFKYKVFNVDL